MPEPKSSPEPQPGGDTIPDMLGGEARPATSHRFRLPRDMVGWKWQAFADFVDAELANGVPGKVLRGENEDNLRRLKAIDTDLYDAVQGRLSGG